MNQHSILKSKNSQAGPKTPKTRKGLATKAKLLEAAEAEFGERGYHDGSIVEITRRAGVGLGTFYVYFESKEAVFRALDTHMGQETRAHIARQVEQAPDRLSAERIGMRAFFEFARSHRNLYKIVMESQFVAEDSYRAYYDSFAEGYRRNLQAAVDRGEIRPGDADIRAWSLIGLSVFLGMRYAIWDETADLEPVVDAALDMIERGLSLGPKP